MSYTDVKEHLSDDQIARLTILKAYETRDFEDDTVASDGDVVISFEEKYLMGEHLEACVECMMRSHNATMAHEQQVQANKRDDIDK